jgi:hypothetical protein
MATKNSHLSDPALAAFLNASFDPAEYLNSTLPVLQVSAKPQSSSSLPALSTETQALLATLNAQATRLTNTLTQLTDDILRSGSRLAYQVDVLRSESSALSETFSERLLEDIEVFAPPKDSDVEDNQEKQLVEDGAFAETLTPNEPSHLSRLRLLVHVKDRLDSVIRVFGAATAWPSPPVSTSSFISVSAPPLSEADKKAKEYAEIMRIDINDLLDSDDEDAAKAKIEELSSLLGVWKGTAEERGRDKFINELVRLVDDRKNGGRRDSTGDDQIYMGVYT